jgi:phosphoglycolate phosphatase
MTDTRLAIFDFDGTLADSAAWAIGLFNPLADKFGFKRVSRDEIEMLRGQSNREILRYMAIPMWKLPSIAKHARELGRRDAHLIPLFPGAAELLSRLDEAGVRIAIVSSNGEDTIRTVLGPELAARVAHYGCGASLFGKAAKFRGAMKACGATKQATVCVGDEGRDIEAARQVGLKCVAVTWGYATEAALREAEPDVMVGSFDELAAALA